MLDPRDDARDRDGRGDGRECVYDERDRDDDPREGRMRGLDLPRGEERELVAVRDHVHELDGEDSRTLAAVGAFRVVPEHDLDIDHDTLDHLRDEGLVETVELGDDGRGLTLTREERECSIRIRWTGTASPHRRSTPASAVSAKSGTTRTSTPRTARRRSIVSSQNAHGQLTGVLDLEEDAVTLACGHLDVRLDGALLTVYTLYKVFKRSGHLARGDNSRNSARRSTGRMYE